MEFPRDPKLAIAGGVRCGISFLERESERRSGDPVEIALGSSTGSSSRYIVFAADDICRKFWENSCLGIGETGFGMAM
jgi:hypothetical protein